MFFLFMIKRYASRLHLLHSQLIIQTASLLIYAGREFFTVFNILLLLSAHQELVMSKHSPDFVEVNIRLWKQTRKKVVRGNFPSHENVSLYVCAITTTCKYVLIFLWRKKTTSKVPKGLENICDQMAFQKITMAIFLLPLWRGCACWWKKAAVTKNINKGT